MCYDDSESTNREIKAFIEIEDLVLNSLIKVANT